LKRAAGWKEESIVMIWVAEKSAGDTFCGDFCKIGDAN
jgi:hypothetical protein